MLSDLPSASILVAGVGRGGAYVRLTRTGDHIELDHFACLTGASGFAEVKCHCAKCRPPEDK